MIGEYEIPKGSKLYFGESARKKRQLENLCVAVLEKHGFEEIVTPAFSYHQSLSNPKEVIRISDEENNMVALRADSSLEVVRLIGKRLGRSTPQRKWFYVQPVFKYPTGEIHQIGAEWTESGHFEGMIAVAAELLAEAGLAPVLQLGNIRIPRRISELAGIDHRLFADHDMRALMEREEPWLRALLVADDAPSLRKAMELVEDGALLEELELLASTAEKVNYPNLAVTPVYHAHTEYYDGLYFRFIQENKRLVMGGSYDNDGEHAVGFGLYTDEVLSF